MDLKSSRGALGGPLRRVAPSSQPAPLTSPVNGGAGCRAALADRWNGHLRVGHTGCGPARAGSGRLHHVRAAGVGKHGAAARRARSGRPGHRVWFDNY